VQVVPLGQQIEPPGSPTPQQASSQQPEPQQFCPAVQQKLPELQHVLLQQVGLPLASWQQLSPSAQHRLSAQQVPLGAQHWPLQTLAARASPFTSQQRPPKQFCGLQHVAPGPKPPHNT
jgi:hypothetical protein